MSRDMRAALGLVLWLAGVVLIIILASGCTPLSEKAERYSEVGERFLNPDEVKIEYHREGNDVSGYEMRCFGGACQDMPTN